MFVWSLLLSAAGLVSLYLAGLKNLWAWVVGIGTQLLWATYAITTAQYGFLLSAVAFTAMYVRNWWLWRRPDPTDTP